MVGEWDGLDQVDSCSVARFGASALFILGYLLPLVTLGIAGSRLAGRLTRCRPRTSLRGIPQTPHLRRRRPFRPRPRADMTWMVGPNGWGWWVGLVASVARDKSYLALLGGGKALRQCLSRLAHRGAVVGASSYSASPYLCTPDPTPGPTPDSRLHSALQILHVNSRILYLLPPLPLLVSATRGPVIGHVQVARRCVIGTLLVVKLCRWLTSNCCAKAMHTWAKIYNIPYTSWRV
jgi:hypothetical protein